LLSFPPPPLSPSFFPFSPAKRIGHLVITAKMRRALAVAAACHPLLSDSASFSFFFPARPLAAGTRARNRRPPSLFLVGGFFLRKLIEYEGKIHARPLLSPSSQCFFPPIAYLPADVGIRERYGRRNDSPLSFFFFFFQAPFPLPTSVSRMGHRSVIDRENSTCSFKYSAPSFFFFSPSRFSPPSFHHAAGDANNDIEGWRRILLTFPFSPSSFFLFPSS